MKTDNFKCALISITGFPNAGKSTLLNSIIKEKISIISSKAQTTRNSIRGILNKDKNQLVFIDTPGILKPKTYLDKNMTRSIYHSFKESDINLYIHDIRRNISLKDMELLNDLFQHHPRNNLILNKIDLINKEEILNVVNDLNKKFNFNSTFLISATKKKGLDFLISSLIKQSPLKSWVYKENQKTNQKIIEILSEITREKIFQLTNKEVPYSVSIKTRLVNKRSLIKIHQIINVLSESQKPIIIGKNGEKIKEIGTRSRHDMERKLKQKVFLDLLVVVKN